jgi:RNA 2',3'-cyclic 3'-phosphodiesterase
LFLKKNRSPNFDGHFSHEKMKTGEKKLRLFVAYPLPQELWSYAEQVRRNNAAITNLRWTPHQNLHITVFFLGEVEEADLEKIKDKIRNEVFRAMPFKPVFEKISAQKGRRHSGMIWMKFLKDEKFSSLYNELKKSLEEFMLHPATIHDPIPHITIARWKGDLDTEEINTDFDTDFQIPEINFCELWQSESTPAGVRYRRLDRFEMAT